VNRLLSRFLGLHAFNKSKAVLDILWAGATSFISDEECNFPGDVNQALIELGSTVCRPRDPTCISCPLKNGCVAYQETEVCILSEMALVLDNLLRTLEHRSL
jgi:A/G-specific adenine glycosylase